MNDEGVSRYIYGRDDNRRRLRITAIAPLRAEDLILIVDRQAAEGTWSYGLVYDVRAVEMTAPPPPEEARAIAQHVLEYTQVYGQRGSVALVTRQSNMIALGQMYAALGAKIGFRVEVFWDLDDAEAWLDQRSGL
jgi:hypothetical protein